GQRLISMSIHHRIVLANMETVSTQVFGDFECGTFPKVVGLRFIGHSDENNFRIRKVSDSFSELCRYPHGHRVVDPPGCGYQLRVGGIDFSQEPGIDWNAVAPNANAGAKYVDTGMCVGNFDRVIYVYSEAFGHHRELVR